MGNKVSSKLSKDPEVAEYYEAYDMCRTREFVTFRKPEGTSGKERIVTAFFPTGFSAFPREGGLDDQDYLTVKLFSAALRAEREGFQRLIAK